MNRRGESIPLIGGRFCLGHSSTQTGRYQLPEAGQAPLLVVLQVRVTGPVPGLVTVKLLPEADFATIW
jgi:hypothetical protein